MDCRSSCDGAGVVMIGAEFSVARRFAFSSGPLCLAVGLLLALDGTEGGTPNWH